MHQRQDTRHVPHCQRTALEAVEREIAFAEAQLFIYSGDLGPHHNVNQQQMLARLHQHLDALEARRRQLAAEAPT